jgi:hypothetical protein
VLLGRVDAADLAVAVGVVQRQAQVAHRHAEHAGLVAVDLQRGLQAAVLRVAGHVAEVGVGAHALHQARGPRHHLARVHALQRVLEARLALAPAQAQVLHRLHVHRNARDLAKALAQRLEHLRHLRALAARLEHRKEPPRVLRGGGAAHADEGGHVVHARVVVQRVGHAVLQRLHGAEGNVFGGLGGDLDLADVFLGEEALGNGGEEPAGDHEGERRGQQHHAAVAQRPVERAHVARVHAR